MFFSHTDTTHLGSLVTRNKASKAKKPYLAPPPKLKTIHVRSRTRCLLGWRQRDLRPAAEEARPYGSDQRCESGGSRAGDKTCMSDV